MWDEVEIALVTVFDRLLSPEPIHMELALWRWQGATFKTWELVRAVSRWPRRDLETLVRETLGDDARRVGGMWLFGQSEYVSDRDMPRFCANVMEHG